MNRSSQRRLATLSGASAVQMASNAAAALIATRALGLADRGVMVLGLTVGSIVGMACGLGTGTALRSRLPTATGDHERRDLLAAYTWCSIGAAVLGPVVAIAAMAGSAGFIDPALGTTPFLLATGAFTVAQTLLTQVVEAWYADGRFRHGSIAAAMMSGSGLACVAVAVATSRSAAVVLSAQAAGMLAVALFELGALYRAGLVVLPYPGMAAVRCLVRRGLPALGLTVGMALTLRADRYLLGALAGTAAVGVYSLAATISEVSRILPSALGQIFLRDVSLGQGAARLARVSGFAIAAAILCGALVLAGGWLLIVPIFGAEFAGARELLLVLVLAEVCFAPYVISSRGLLGGGWTRTACVFGIGGSIAALAVYAVAASLGGAFGVAVGSATMYGALSAVSWVLLEKHLTRDKPLSLAATGPNGAQS
jgi:O-antigen/teichoic acid export membrane protein